MLCFILFLVRSSEQPTVLTVSVHSKQDDKNNHQDDSKVRINHHFFQPSFISAAFSSGLRQNLEHEMRKMGAFAPDTIIFFLRES